MIAERWSINGKALNDTLRRLPSWFAPRQSLTSRYKPSTQIQDDCNAGCVASKGLMRRARDIVSVRLEKSLERSLDRSILRDHQDSQQDVRPSDRKHRTRHRTQPWSSSQVEYREHQAVVPQDTVGIIVDRPTTSNIWWPLRANRRAPPRHYFPPQQK